MKDLDDAFSELRRKHREVSAPPRLETRLRAAVRASRRRRISAWIWAAAAALLMTVVTWRMNQPSRAILSRDGTQNQDVGRLNPLRPPMSSPASTTTAASKPLNSTPSVRHHWQPARQSAEFVILPGSEVLPVPAETAILRMELTKGELRRYGVDVLPTATAELVRADFVVGDDGLARAFRFVR